ncbi:sulfite exporter TauE/SafE family protein [Leucobacter ruminantium]|uniref:Probable membrane transporter protein n=1 Tax=Leucobacter ruminantium TaxID=1289170 RepID=A0A939LXQ8_9MICO|nr:sulfite exporter TauE/SafE family protein [Leucobacter ruminantium]MBO1806620.1 sulfite exporter TauE/SafE family protein [Leucobacter ruminantium]
MEPTLVIALLAAVLVGFSLGLLGGGGSILTTPILVYLLGMEPRAAIASSLFIVGVTSAVGLLGHARAGRVRWRTGLFFGGAGMAGAFAGGLLGGWIPGPVLMILFAVMMIATATAMIRGRRPAVASASAGTDDTAPPVARMLLVGLLVGLATGLVGAGGGFLIVPALHLLGGLPMVAAVATSLFVIVMNTATGLTGALVSVQIDWPIVLAFTGIAVAGPLLGARFAGRLPERALRRGFGVFVLAMGALVLAQEIPNIAAGIA